MKKLVRLLALASCMSLSFQAISATKAIFDRPITGDADNIALDYAIDIETIDMINSVESGGEILGAIYFINDVKVPYNGVNTTLSATLKNALERGVAIHIITETHKYGNAGALNGLNSYSNFTHTTCEGSCMYGPSSIDQSYIMHSKFWAVRKHMSDGYYTMVSSHNYNPSQQKYHQQALVFENDKPAYDLYKSYFDDLIVNKGSREDDYYKSVMAGGSRFYFFPRKSGDLIVSALSNLDASKGECNIHIAMASWTTTRSDIIEKLKELSVAGCNVNLVIDTEAGSAAIDAFLNTGINGKHHNVNLIKNSKIHSKYMLIDGYYNGKWSKLTWSGSHNFTNNALRYNDETLVKTFSASLYNQFLANWKTLPQCNNSLKYAKGNLVLDKKVVNAPGSDNDPYLTNGEWVQFKVTGTQCVDVSGWKLSDRHGNYYVFPEGTIMAPLRALRVHSGCENYPVDTNWSSGDISRNFVFGALNKSKPCQAVWNNSGDTITLKDKNGNTILSKSY